MPVCSFGDFQFVVIFVFYIYLYVINSCYLHVGTVPMQLGKLSREYIEKELITTGLSSEAVHGIIEVLSPKSLSKLAYVLRKEREVHRGIL